MRSPIPPQYRMSDVHNPTHRGRQAAMRLVAVQAAAVALVALAWWLVDARSALAVVVSGGSVVVGSGLLAWLALGGGVSPAGVVLGRLLTGMALKWCVVIAALYAALGPWALPALPVLVGAVVATMAHVLLGRFNPSR